jgi:hypothetical protein
VARVSNIREILIDYTAKLEALGSADAIALHLQSKEVKAVCGSYSRCALVVDASAAVAEHGIPSTIKVGACIYYIREDTGFTGAVRLPEVAHDFIRRFDSGQYKELIK